MARQIQTLLFLLTATWCFGQQQEPPDSTKSNLVIIDRADKVQKTVNKKKEEVLILTGNVLMHQDSLFVQCDSARKELNNLHAEGNVLLQQWDTINVFANILDYYGDTNQAFLKDSVVLQSKEQKLFTDSLSYNTKTRVATYEDGATLTNDTVFLYSRKGTFYVSTDEVYFKDSVYIKSDDFELYTDTMRYNTAEKKAYFLGPTRIDLASGSQVYCEAGYFDLANEKALFTQNAQFVDEEQVGQGDSIVYDGKLKKITMLGNASLKEPGKDALADTIIYLEQEKKLTLLGNAFFQDSLRTMRSRAMEYDIDQDKLVSNSRSNLDNPPQFLEADYIDFDNARGVGIAIGDVIWSDTASHFSILCEEAHYDDSTKYLKAYGGRPLFINQIDADSFFLSADTLISYETVTDEDTSRNFRAYNDVKIFKSDLQAKCDSLTFSSSDSLFHLYEDPIIWSDTSQFVADSVSILLADNKIDKIFLKQNAFIINSADQILFNQMKGKEITAYFEEGEVNRMLIKGNASSIYYVLDDFKAYIGVNETLCSSMLLRFGSNEVTSITFYDNPLATFHPIQKADTESLKLEGFQWRGSERPKSLSEITTFVLK